MAALWLIAQIWMLCFALAWASVFLNIRFMNCALMMPAVAGGFLLLRVFI